MPASDFTSPALNPPKAAPKDYYRSYSCLWSPLGLIMCLRRVWERPGKIIFLVGEAGKLGSGTFLKNRQRPFLNPPTGAPTGLAACYDPI